MYIESLLLYLIFNNLSNKEFINKDEALAFADFLVSKEAQEIIKEFKVDLYGEPLFFPNAKK
mgnify:CR=1 FL=1